MTNAAKHAHASIVNIELDTRAAILQLAIRDDGIGGTLQVTSPAGHGTTLLMDVPLEGQSSVVSPEP